MDTRITIVVDNNVQGTLGSEHGFSMWIESGGKRILFDTGQGPALESNVPKLGIDIGAADLMVLSHGHYDHTGGLPYVVAHAPKIEIYCHPGAVQPRYAIRDGKTRSIGIPHASAEALERFPSERLHWVPEPVMLTESIGLTGPIPRVTAYEDTGGPFFLDPQGTRPDLIEDDQALWIQTHEGLVVCMGCAHAGLINTLYYLLDLTKSTRSARSSAASTCSPPVRSACRQLSLLSRSWRPKRSCRVIARESLRCGASATTWESRSRPVRRA